MVTLNGYPFATDDELTAVDVNTLVDAVTDAETNITGINDDLALVNVELGTQQTQIDAIVAGTTVAPSDGSVTDVKLADAMRAVMPVSLRWDATDLRWEDASGNEIDQAARAALRPHPIYWLCPSGSEPTWSANAYDANETYGDLVHVKAAAA